MASCGSMRLTFPSQINFRTRFVPSLACSTLLSRPNMGNFFKLSANSDLLTLIKTNPPMTTAPAAIIDIVTAKRSLRRRMKLGEQQHHETDPGDPADLRAAAAGKDRDHKGIQTGDDDEERRPDDVHHARLMRAKDGGHRLNDSARGDKERDDEIGGDEDGVAHVARHALRHIASPRKRIDVQALDRAVNRHRKRGDDHRVQQPVELRAGAHARQDHEEDQDVREVGVGPLQALMEPRRLVRGATDMSSSRM